MNWFIHRPLDFEFKGKWVQNWFSNMTETPIEINGVTFRSVENYYQYAKGGDPRPEVAEYFAKCTPSKSKYEGRLMPPRKNWEDIKEEYMRKALVVKFNQPKWKEKLLATGDDMIIEWNNWNDKYWGVSIVDNQGYNRLGVILMSIRKQLQDETNHH